MSNFTDAIARNLRGLAGCNPGAAACCNECLDAHGLSRTVECDACDGIGFEPAKLAEKCEACGGSGEITRTNEELQAELYEAGAGENFSWGECDSCGSSLGGHREPAHAFTDAGEVIHLDICADCVLFHANGDEPENWGK